tara:strand:+ start:171 stop:743 length:573 start_codon:yes stop_codon:yes gene_type:complete
MPRIPGPINWLRQRNDPNDLLMTYAEMRERVRGQEYMGDIQYSQIMGPDEVKKFLSDMVDTWLDSLELREIQNPSREGVTVETMLVERLVPQWNNGEVAIFFKGLDDDSTDDDSSARLGMLMPDADLEEVRNDILEIIDEYLTPPVQVSQITLYMSDFRPTTPERFRPKSQKILFRPLNPINLDEMFGLE